MCDLHPNDSKHTRELLKMCPPNNMYKQSTNHISLNKSMSTQQYVQTISEPYPPE